MTGGSGPAGPASTGSGPTDADRRRLRQAIGLARRCPPSTTAFSVGAIIVGPDGRELSRGFSRQHDPVAHAEEEALAGLPPGSSLGEAGTTIYSSLEPCSRRASRPRTCTELIIAAGVPRVVFAWREPPVFVDCDGTALLRAAGVEVVEVPDLAALAREPNAHLLS